MKPQSILILYRISCMACAIMALVPGFLGLFAGHAISSFLDPVSNEVTSESAAQPSPTTAQKAESEELEHALKTVDAFGASVTGIGVFFFVVAVFNVAMSLVPRSPFWWRVHIFNLFIHLFTLVLAAPALIILVQWFLPEVKAYFGITPPGEPTATAPEG